MILILDNKPWLVSSLETDFAVMEPIHWEGACAVIPIGGISVEELQQILNGVTGVMLNSDSEGLDFFG